MKSGNRIIVVTGGILALLLVGRIGLGFLNQPSDKQLITEAINEAAKASREGRPGGVTDFLSTSLTVNQEQSDASKSDVGNYIKKLKPDVKFAKVDPQVFGEEARVDTSASLTVGVLGFTRNIDIPNVVITLKKEQEYEWLIIPKKSWKVTDIRVPLDQIPTSLPGM